MSLQYAAAKSGVILLYHFFKKAEKCASKPAFSFFFCFSEQWQETTLSMLSLSFIVYGRARNKAEEGSCVSQRGGMAYPALGLCTHTHTLGPVGPTGLSGSCSAPDSLRLHVCVQKNPSIHVEG